MPAARKRSRSTRSGDLSLLPQEPSSPLPSPSSPPPPPSSSSTTSPSSMRYQREGLRRPMSIHGRPGRSLPLILDCSMRGSPMRLVLLLLAVATWTSSAQKICNGVALVDCKRRYERCKLFDGPSMDKQLTLCKCAKLFYGTCLREAGCASDHMVQCIDDMVRNECTDMSVCGNNCASPNEVPTDAIIIPVNNYGENYIRFGYCNSTALDENYLAKYSTVRIEKCVEGAYTFCPYWVPPKTFTSLAIPASAEYINMWYCQLTEVGGNITHSSCLSHYDEVYGQPKLWPSSLDIEFANAYRCETDADCHGSFCDFHFHPPICSPGSPPSSSVTQRRSSNRPLGRVGP